MTDLIEVIDNNFNFNNETVRITGSFEDPWFIAKDVCSILGLSNVTEAVRPLPEKWRGLKLLSTPSGNQNTNIINEAGLYRLIMRSNKTIAQKFQEWVCEEVLPNIRKKGEYRMNEEYQSKLKKLEQEKLDTEKKLDMTDYVLKKTKKELEDEKASKNLLLKRRYYEGKEGDSIYVFQDDISNEKSDIKIGKTKDIKKRENDYSRMSKTGSIIYMQYCINCDITEKVLHHMLDKYRMIRNQEWFHNLPSIDFVIQTVKTVIYIMDSQMEDVEKFIPNLYSTLKIDSKIISDVPLKLPKKVEIAKDETIIEPIKKIVIETEAEESNEKVLEEVSKHIVHGRSTPLDFDKFISDYCEVGEKLFAPQSDIRDAYRIWSNCSKNEVKNKLASFMKEKFKTGVEFIGDARRNVYRGLKLNLMEYKPSTKILDYEEFIIDRCEVNYTNSITFVEFFKYFEEWKQSSTPDYKLNSSYKAEVQKYLETIFMLGTVKSMSEEHKSKALFGVWGICFKDNKTDKISTRQKLQVGEYDIDNNLIRTFDSVIIASKETGITYHSLGYHIRFEKVLNNKIYKFIKNE
jgi:anti-repressor protein